MKSNEEKDRLNTEINTLIADPRYWRDHDPEIVRQVNEKFYLRYGTVERLTFTS